MALETEVKRGLERIARALRAYAHKQGWAPDDYRVFVSVNRDWGRIYLILVARAFPAKRPEDQWLSVLNYLEEELDDDPDLLESLNLSLRTFEEVAEGGLYEVGPTFVDIAELLADGLAAGRETGA